MEMKLTTPIKKRRRREMETKMVNDCGVMSLVAMDGRENGREEGAWRRRN